MDALVETEKLTKTFSGANALDQVDLSLPSHSVIGLIGRNGSGKTTLIRHIIGLYLPTSGSCRTLGTASGELTGSAHRPTTINAQARPSTPSKNLKRA